MRTTRCFECGAAVVGTCAYCDMRAHVVGGSSRWSVSYHWHPFADTMKKHMNEHMTLLGDGTGRLYQPKKVWRR